MEFKVDVEYGGDDITVQGECSWNIENDAFDYAGTHCTHGVDGTQQLPDYCQLSWCSIEAVTGSDGNDLAIDTPEELAKIEHLVSIKLQEQEDDTGDVMRQIDEYNEELKVDMAIEAKALQEEY